MIPRSLGQKGVQAGLQTWHALRHQACCNSYLHPRFCAHRTDYNSPCFDATTLLWPDPDVNYTVTSSFI